MFFLTRSNNGSSHSLFTSMNQATFLKSFHRFKSSTLRGAKADKLLKSAVCPFSFIIPFLNGVRFFFVYCRNNDNNQHYNDEALYNPFSMRNCCGPLPGPAVMLPERGEHPCRRSGFHHPQRDFSRPGDRRDIAPYSHLDSLNGERDRHMVKFQSIGSKRE